MSEIQDAHHPKNDGEARGHQEKKHSINETVNRLNSVNLNRIGHQEIPFYEWFTLCKLCHGSISPGFSLEKTKDLVFL